MTDIIQFDGPTTHDLDPARMLRAIAADPPAEVFVIGRDANGTLTFHASHGDSYAVVAMIEEFKHRLFSGEFG